MSYRKITVNNNDYEYVIGRSHVKIKGIGVWPLDQIGERVAKMCDCGCDELLDNIYTDLSDDDYHYVVRPSHIRFKIENTIK
jgi:hypothetical protein